MTRTFCDRCKLEKRVRSTNVTVGEDCQYIAQLGELCDDCITDLVEWTRVFRRQPNANIFALDKEG